MDSIALAATLTPGDLEVNVPPTTRWLPAPWRGQAGYGIAGDEHLLTLERYGRTVILPPRRFPDLIEEIQSPG